MTDQYERSAEFIDVMLVPHWKAVAPPLTKALRALEPGTIVDLGAGTGLGTLVIADALPDAEIVAIEPSPTLRTALMARIYERPELRDRVTVLSGGLLKAALPDKLSGVMALSVLGHLAPEERQRLWSLGCPVILNLQPPAEPVAVPMGRFSDVRLGRLRYEGWGRAEPAGSEAVSWHMVYRVYEEEQLTREVEVSYEWHVINEETLRAEVAEHGLAVNQIGASELGLYVVHEDTHA